MDTWIANSTGYTFQDSTERSFQGLRRAFQMRSVLKDFDTELRHGYGLDYSMYHGHVYGEEGLTNQSTYLPQVHHSVTSVSRATPSIQWDLIFIASTAKTYCGWQNILRVYEANTQISTKWIQWTHWNGFIDQDWFKWAHWVGVMAEVHWTG